MSIPRRLSLGITYWPRMSGYHMWQHYDRGAVREELAQIATFGCTLVRFCLTWEVFQPGAERLDTEAMRQLEHALDTAHETGLRTVVCLFPVAGGGALALPAWANGPDILGQLRSSGPRGHTLLVRPPGITPVVSGGAYRPFQADDLYSGALLEAQRYLVREAIGYFGRHPALDGRQLGEGFEHLQQPESAAAADAWLRTLAAEARRAYPHARLIGMASQANLMHATALRPEQLTIVYDTAAITVDPAELAPGQRHSDAPVFLHALMAGLTQRPTIVAGLGMPTAPREQSGWMTDQAYGRSIRRFMADEEGQAQYLATTLDRLWRAGAAGIWLAAYADHPPELWRRAPLDRSVGYRSMGVVDRHGREKPAAALLRRFAGEVAAHDTERPLPAAIDAEHYWREPARRLAELWREFAV
ncbi:MAG TPA: hypothetical protein PKA05_06375 [Roseiflexaceae bacterium]|nr:hypothetical protein [Roseiflexaceae bacterium]